MSRDIGDINIIGILKNEPFGTFWSKLLTYILCYAQEVVAWSGDWAREPDPWVNH